LKGKKLEKHNEAVHEYNKLISNDQTEALVNLQEGIQIEKKAFKMLGSGESRKEIEAKKK
jgi:hypothetical protein